MSKLDKLEAQVLEMQAEIEKLKREEVATKYPYYGKSEKGQIILFTKPTTGTNVNGVLHKLGHFSHGWAEETFTLYTGTLNIVSGKVAK